MSKPSQVSKPAPTRPNVHGQGRRLLLAAATELFAERGYSGTSTRDIAERAGVTEPMVFRHFGNKANLFQEAAATPFVEFMNRYITDYRGREHGRLTAEEEGRWFFEGLFNALHEQRHVLMALISAHQFNEIEDDISEQVQAAFGQVLNLFEEVVSTEAAERGFSTQNLAASVKVMFSMVLSVALHGDWMMIHTPESYDEILSAMTRMAVRGLAVPPNPAI